MATMSPTRFDVDALRRDYPLSSVIEANGITLTAAGPQRLKGLCPFHDDRHPSLIVYLDDQHFHCFACGAHGDVVDFVRRRFHLSVGRPFGFRKRAMSAQNRAGLEIVLPRRGVWGRSFG